MMTIRNKNNKYTTNIVKTLTHTPKARAYTKKVGRLAEMVILLWKSTRQPSWKGWQKVGKVGIYMPTICQLGWHRLTRVFYSGTNSIFCQPCQPCQPFSIELGLWCVCGCGEMGQNQ